MYRSDLAFTQITKFAKLKLMINSHYMRCHYMAEIFWVGINSGDQEPKYVRFCVLHKLAPYYIIQFPFLS